MVELLAAMAIMGFLAIMSFPVIRSIQTNNTNTKFEEYGVTHVILYENSKLAMILKSDSDYNLIYSKGSILFNT